MNKVFGFVFCFLILALPCRAADVTVTDSQGLRFGSFVLTHQSPSASVGISYTGQVIYVNTIRNSTIVGGGTTPTAGRVTFSSDLDEMLRIEPAVTSSTELLVYTIGGCTIKLINPSFSSNSIELTQSSGTASFDIGGQIQFSGSCSSIDNGISTHATIPYNVFDANGNLITQINNTIAVTFSISPALEMGSTSDLNFGTITTRSISGEVILTASGGTTFSGGVVQVTGASPGSLFISGSNGAVIDISSDDQIFLSDGQNQMIVDNFTFSPGTRITLNGENATELKVGGTLHVNENQSAGAYNGILNVYISY